MKKKHEVSSLIQVFWRDMNVLAIWLTDLI